MLSSVSHIAYLKIFVQKKNICIFCHFTFNGDIFKNIIGVEVVFYTKLWGNSNAFLWTTIFGN